MTMPWSRCVVALTLATTMVACSSTDSATNLNPAGPPMIQQVRLFENVTDAAGIVRTNPVFAFGTHPLALDSEQHAVTTAQAGGLNAKTNVLRVIFDELLVGNNLEEIQCRGQVDADGFSRVPLGATPDDVRNCAQANDVLKATCTGAHAMCICDLPTCIRNDNTMVVQGEPVGVQDLNQDGNTDAHQFIVGSAGLNCGGQDIAMDAQFSFYNPSGDQQKPAQGGFDALGPKIVLVPSGLAPHFGALPTNSDCHLTFSPEVVDKDGIAVCAPPGGDIELDCSPGDVAAVGFKVEPLTVVPASFIEGDTGVSRLINIDLAPNTQIDPTKLNTITVLEGAANFTAFTISLISMNAIISIHPTAATGLKANTKYTITVPTTLTDTYGQPLPQTTTFTFTTGA
jgi:hypothetical protein